MNLRRRVIVLSGVAVAVAVAAVSIVTYLLVRDELRGRVDSELRHDVSTYFAPGGVTSDPPPLAIDNSNRHTRAELSPRAGAAATRRLHLPETPFGGRSLYAQVVSADGEVIRPGGPRTSLQSIARARQVARGDGDQFFSDIQADGAHLRVFTTRIARGQAVQVARPLDEVDHTLSRLAVIFAVVSLGGIALAGVLGWFVSRAAVAPVERLRRAAEEVATTRDLSRRIEATGNDELAALAGSFNQMLERAGELAQRAAPARGRRLARAPHPACQPAHQHRGADPLRPDRRGRAPSAARRRRLPARGADRARRRPRRPRPRERARDGAADRGPPRPPRRRGG